MPERFNLLFPVACYGATDWAFPEFYRRVRPFKKGVRGIFKFHFTSEYLAVLLRDLYSGIHLWPFRMDPRLLPAGMTEGGIADDEREQK